MTDYCIACFNGKFGWVPFVDKLMSTAEELAQIDKDHIDDEMAYKMVVDFDQISYSN